MLVALSGLTAEAAEPLVPRWDEGSVRTLKIDLFAFAPGVHPWGSDWKVTMLEQWTAIVECRPTGARVEVCTFPHGVWWGYVLEGSTEFAAVNLGAPGAMEITWTPRGRISGWDVQGDRQAFWEITANTFVQTTFHRSDMVFKPDAQREIGAEVERSLVRGLAAALEWEVAKKGDPSPIWKLSGPPWSARRWIQGTATARDLDMHIASEDAEGVHLALTGRVVEMLPADSGTSMSAETQVVGNATFDRAKGQIVSAFTETLASSTQPLVGHTRSITLVRPWKEGDSASPADLPKPLLGE